MYVYLGRAEPAPRPAGETPGPVTPLALTRVLDTTPAPFRYVCRIFVRAQNGRYYIGSGVLIGRHHVLTCAHVLYDFHNPHPKEITVWPAHNGPNDKQPHIRANGWAINPRWSWSNCMTGDEDLGIVRLARPWDGGFWPITPFEPSILTNAAAHLAGYPAFTEKDEAHWMYRSRGRITGRVQIASCTPPTPTRSGTTDGRVFTDISDATKLIAHETDTRPVMSGGPLWTFQEAGKSVLFALHAGNIGGGNTKTAVLLNSAVRSRINEWMTRTLPPI